MASSSSASSKPAQTDPIPDQVDTSFTRLPLEEESALLTESQELKATATKAFTSGDSSSALDFYNRALTPLPVYLSFDVAVLQANISACHIRLEQWKEAAEAATKSLDELDFIDPVSAAPGKNTNGKENASAGADDRVVEVDDELEARLEMLSESGKSLEDVRKLRVKALLRRAKSKTEIGSWAELQGALEDYTALSKISNLTSTDQKTVQTALRAIPPKLDEQKQKEMADMMGNLKKLGNGILKPFGLSTDNFQFVKDEATGGYNMNFNK